MSDLTALVLIVAPTQPLTAPAHLGRAAHALLLQLIRERDPALAADLHDSDAPRPFTCSTLIGGRREGRFSRTYLPDQSAWLRFTALTPSVSAQLQQLAATPPPVIELDGYSFQVTQATLDPVVHPWAGQDNYQTLAAPYLLAQTPPQFHVALQFASPTTFRSSGISQPIPLPDWVFGSLLNRWNLFSSIQLAEEVRRYAAECIALSHYRLRTQAIPLKAQVVQMGCVGSARYHLLNRDKFWGSMINLLAAYSFYSGVGYQTTVGLGQTRLAPASGAAPG